MSAFFFEAGAEKFDPTWIEFNKPIFIAGHGYVGSVSLDTKTPDRPDRPSVAGCSKTPDGWLVWMKSGNAAVIPETNIKYVGAARVETQERQREIEAEDKAHEVTSDNSPEMRFAHLPDGVREKIIAQAKGGFAGDAPLAGLAQVQTAMRAVAASIDAKVQLPEDSPEPVKKRRGRPPKVRPEVVSEPQP